MESFDPEKEIANIKEIPKEKRGEVLGEIRRKLLILKKLEVKLQADLRLAVYENPSLSAAELLEKAEKIISDSDVEPPLELREDLKEAIDNYEKVHQAILKIRKQYPNDADLFRALCGKPLLGRIEVNIRPFFIEIVCFDKWDFANLYFYNSDNQDDEISKEEYEHVSYVGGLFRYDGLLISELNGLVVVLNSFNTDEDKIQSSRIHEENHAWSELLGFQHSIEAIEDADFKDIENSPEQFQGLRKEMKAIRHDLVEDTLQSEMLSHLREGNDPELVFSALTSSASYNYLEKTIEVFNKKAEQMPPEIKEKVKEIIEEVFVTDYHKLIKECAESFWVLIDKFNYSPDQAVAFLTHEPLYSWQKAVSRLEKEEGKRLYKEYKEGFDKSGEELRKLSSKK